MNLGQLLNTKEFKYQVVVTIGHNESVATAIRKMMEYDRSSLPVYDDKGELVGIVTERDVVRRCFANDTSTAKIKVRDVMTKEVIIGVREDDVDYAISVMKDKRIRHLPIVENRKVVGMISMRDLLGFQLEEYRSQARLLNNYISGNYR
ncbi:MAG: CBS domain-containing protein [Chloroflexi bacterium]|nr:CBS domain-containing protein [Chloroflexota bacterium]